MIVKSMIEHSTDLASGERNARKRGVVENGSADFRDTSIGERTGVK